MKEITIVWSVEDVRHLRPEVTEERAREMFDRISRPLRDRSIEEGWGILETLLQIVEKEGKAK